MGNYVNELIRQLKLVGEKDMDSRSVAQRNALKAELRRLGNPHIQRQERRHAMKKELEERGPKMR